MKMYQNILMKSRLSKWKQMLRKIYLIHDQTESFFENMVRSQHPTRAKEDIVMDDMLPLTDLEKIMLQRFLLIMEMIMKRFMEL